MAIRADGSTATLPSGGFEAKTPIREFVDLDQGYFTGVDPLTSLYFRQPISQRRATRMGAYYSQCEMAFQSAGADVQCEQTNEERFGRKMVKVTRVHHASEPPAKETILADPSLNWLVIERATEVEGRVSWMKADSLLTGPPDPAFFSVPPDYRMPAKLSEFLKAGKRARGEPDDPPAGRPDHYERIDAYVERRAISNEFRRFFYASRGFTTLPWTSVSRKWRPWYL
ncbi:MAG: hypothetical protein KIT09_25085 [Bryobacteraceae bacterium]|nr:hypothetical protein [Bryobacteraceae bacterium]